jgi:hypothetical protein
VCSLAAVTIFALLGNWVAVALNVAPLLMNLGMVVVHWKLTDLEAVQK